MQRPLLADIIQPDDVKELCKLLVVESREISKRFSSIGMTIIQNNWNFIWVILSMNVKKFNDSQFKLLQRKKKRSKMLEKRKFLRMHLLHWKVRRNRKVKELRMMMLQGKQLRKKQMQSNLDWALLNCRKLRGQCLQPHWHWCVMNKKQCSWQHQHLRMQVYHQDYLLPRAWQQCTQNKKNVFWPSLEIASESLLHMGEWKVSSYHSIKPMWLIFYMASSHIDCLMHLCI